MESVLIEKIGAVTEEQLAEILGVEQRTLQNWRSQRKGPDYVSVGRRIFYTLEAVRDWFLIQERPTMQDLPVAPVATFPALLRGRSDQRKRVRDWEPAGE
jgi:hypothetical protein